MKTHIKKITGFIITVSLFVSQGTSFAETTQSFSDVNVNHEHYSAIESLKARGIISGYSDGTFKPEGTINRAEAMKVVMLGKSIYLNKEFEPTRDEVTPVEIPNDESSEDSEQDLPFTFSDVPSDSWFEDYVYSAYDQGIVGGYNNGTFRPGNNITKAEALKITLLVFSGQTEFSEPGKNPFLDVPFSEWFSPYVQYAKERFIIEPNVDEMFRPGYDITRGEFAEIIYRLLVIAESDLDVYDPSNSWITFNRSLQGYLLKKPTTWDVYEIISDHDATGTTTLLYFSDQHNTQRTPIRSYPNSGSLEIHISNQTYNIDTYFAQIRNAFGESSIITETQTGGLRTLVVESDQDTEHLLDAYIALPGNRVAALYGTYGNGAFSYVNEYFITKMRESFSYTETSVIDDSNIEEILSQSRASIQIDGKGLETLKLFDDLTIIETDTIGVGTGPVDYYYSQKADITLKHERSFDVILDIEDGRTSSF